MWITKSFNRLLISINSNVFQQIQLCQLTQLNKIQSNRQIKFKLLTQSQFMTKFSFYKLNSKQNLSIFEYCIFIRLSVDQVAQSIEFNIQPTTSSTMIQKHFVSCSNSSLGKICLEIQDYKSSHDLSHLIKISSNCRRLILPKSTPPSDGVHKGVNKFSLLASFSSRLKKYLIHI